MIADRQDSWKILPLAPGVRRRPDLEDLFRPHREGYLGADGVSSVGLPDGRIFWFFGDTLIGRLNDQGREMDMMPRNTAAIQQPGPPTVDAVKWLFRGERNGLKPFVSLSDTDDDLWFWGGTAVMVGNCLYIFGYGITPGEGDFESLSFALKYPIVVRVKDTSGDPLNWRIEHAIQKHLPANPWFCSGSHVADGRLYLIGLKTPDSWNKTDPTHAVMASVAVAELEEKFGDAHFQFLSNPQGEWSDRVSDAARLFAPGVTESSIYLHESSGKYITTSYDAISGLFMGVVASDLTGPWCEPIPLFRIPGIGPEFGQIAYTLRIHPHLSPRDGLVMSYVVNTSSLETILPRTDLYFPRFVEVAFRALGIGGE